MGSITMPKQGIWKFKIIIIIAIIIIIIMCSYVMYGIAGMERD